MKKYRKFYIEITNRCNLSCSFCPKTKRKPEYMSSENFEKIISKIKDYGDNFYLHVMGEPTSHPEFNQIMDICNKYHIKTNITTNGTLLSRVGDIILSHNVRMVAVSLHSFEANSLDKSMIDYLNGVIDFCNKSLENDTIVELRLWNFDRKSIYDKNQLNGQIIEYLEESLHLNFDLRKAVDEKLERAEKGNQRKFNLHLLGNVYLGMSEHFDWPDIDKEKCFTTGFCYGLRNQVRILANGDVVPCCLDSEGNISLGNIYENDFESIVKGDRAVKLYNGFSDRRVIEPLCQTCGYMNQHIKK